MKITVAGGAGERRLRHACDAPGPPRVLQIRLPQPLRRERPHHRGSPLLPLDHLPHPAEVAIHNNCIIPVEPSKKRSFTTEIIHAYRTVGNTI